MNILIDGQTLETNEINRGIGVYFKNVLCNMVKYTAGNIWYITVSKLDSLAQIDPWVSSRLTPIVDEKFTPTCDYEKEGLFTDQLNKVINEYKIDCLWMPNPLMVNVLFPTKKIKCSFFATIYDLIPYIRPIREWGEDIQKEYFRRLEYLERVNLICISRATESDLKNKISSKANTSVTLLAADENLFYKRKKTLHTGGQIKIVFTGGFDYRKNIYGAIEAFSVAKRMLKEEDCKLYIVCKYSEQEKKIFNKKAQELGVYDDVYLTGFIDDNELARLYQMTDVFFFPSFYEGFGLPLLEAMLSGAYILSANNSSLPEVCGEHALYCDADNIQDMAEKLVLAIHNSLSESLLEKQRRQEYALSFSWKKTAMQTYEAMSLQVFSGAKNRKKIAIVTPWPNQQTGIANYTYRMMPYLSKHFDIDIFVDNTLDRDCDLLPNPYGDLYLIQELDQRYHNYDHQIIYQLGNSTKYHSEIYRMFKKYNGIAEIHDFILSSFFYHSYFLKGDYLIYKQALKDGYGEKGEEYYRKLKAGEMGEDGERFPMSHAISRVAEKTIIHNEWSYHQLGGSANKYLVPHTAFEQDILSKNESYKAKCNVRCKIDYHENEIIIGCFGWLNKNKRPEVVLGSVIELKKIGYPVKLVFFGKSNYENLNKFIIENDAESYVKITGFLTREEYQVAMELCTIVINLRYPSMGEASGTLCEAFKAEKPVIVSAHNQYMEIPNDVCWKLPVGEGEVCLLTEMLVHLLDYPEICSKLASNAKRYVDEVLSGDNIAQLYLRILS